MGHCCSLTAWVSVAPQPQRVASVPESCDAARLASCFLFCGSTQTIVVLVVLVVLFVVAAAAAAAAE